MVLTVDSTTTKSDEVKEVIMGTKNNQAAVQTVCRQRLLCMVGMGLKYMTEIVNKMWEGEERPSRQNKGIICALFREGMKMDCTNFAGVTLYTYIYILFIYSCLLNSVQNLIL